MKQSKLLITLALLLLVYAPKGAAQDTIGRVRHSTRQAQQSLPKKPFVEQSSPTVTLPEISIVTHNVAPEKLHVQTPTQVVATAELVQLGSTLLSDAARRLVGVTLKDYGGVGGVKTVSSRGLGSQFSILTIDGIAVNDCQNGQVDLGRYMLGNSGYISFANGQADNLLQSARAFAAGSILNMETREPEFGLRPYRLGIGMEAGSFGYLMPSISYEQQLGKKLSFSLWGNYLQSQGNYPFTLYYTHTHTDSSSREYRQNSQMHIGTADINLFYRIDRHQRLHLKMHYMNGYHALPGPVIYYTQRGSEHSKEKLFFSQARYQRTGHHWDWLLLGKYQRTTDIYEDTVANNQHHLIHNQYYQQEGYLSQAIRFHAGKKRNGREPLSVSFSLDESLSQLQSNLNHDNNVQRRSLLGVLAAEYSATQIGWLNGLRLNANILGTWVCDYQAGEESSPYTKLSPYAGLSYRLGQFTLRYFFKETYRVPNFNELYYYTIGRPLYPERARQHNLGASFKSCTMELDNDHIVTISATVDLYSNHVDDKIIAIPVQNMYLWSMTNLGKVEVLGIDLNGNASLSGKFDLNGVRRYDIILGVGYSFQYAVDRTTPSGKSYGHQIPYTPRHSGNIALTATTPWVDLGYSVVLVGERYCFYQNTDANRVQGYVDQGVTLTHEFDLSHGSISAKIQILNLFDIQYEVVRSYPMMGRNFRIGLTWTF